MKAIISKTFFLFFILMIIAGISSAQTPAQQFQKGIMKEEGEGSLKEAIELYKLVADNANADKVLRAKALYKMGSCYGKLGQQEARGVYEKLVANYTDPQELVADAKRKLNKLNGEAGTENTGIVARQVWYPAVNGAYPCQPSRDGRYILYIDNNTVQITIRDLKTGKSREVTKDGTWTGNTQYSEACIWSPDGKHIAYNWAILNEPEKKYRDFKNELRVINVDGTNERIIKPTGYYYPLDWSNDGSSILCINESNNLELVSVKDGSSKIIAEIGKLRIGNASFSGDGKFIIFSRESTPESKTFDIFSVPVNGGVMQALITNKENDENPICVPGTNKVVFISNHSGTRDLWLMTVVSGKLEGEPKIIKSGLSESSNITGITDYGELLYTTSTVNPDIYIARLDLNTGEISPSPVRRIMKYTEKPIRSIWSPSLNYLATMVEAPVVSAPQANQVKFVIQNMKTGEEHEIVSDLYTYPYISGFEIKWTTDEQSLLVKGNTNNKTGGIFQVDVKTGKFKDFKVPLEKTAWEWKDLQYSPDGKTMYFNDPVDKTRIETDDVNLISRSVQSGDERNIARMADMRDMLLSPDGKYITFQHSFHDDGSIFVIPIDGSSEIKKITGFTDKEKLCPLGWTSDSQNVLFAKINGSSQVSVWITSINNESPKELFSKDVLKAFTGADGLRILNTGNEYFLTSQKNNPVYELWTLENIIPKELSEKK